jgi:hypothetical protein
MRVYSPSAASAKITLCGVGWRPGSPASGSLEGRQKVRARSEHRAPYTSESYAGIGVLFTLVVRTAGVSPNVDAAGPPSDPVQGLGLPGLFVVMTMTPLAPRIP